MRNTLSKEKHTSADCAPNLQLRLGRRLLALREQRSLSLDGLSKKSGISRATLSRLERGETSPTATMLGSLCSVYGQTTSQLMTDAEAVAPQLVRGTDQTLWTDTETGFKRGIISPPGYGLRGELLEGTLPVGAIITYKHPPLPGLEHHLLMVAGVLELALDDSRYVLQAGDCLRYRLTGTSTFCCRGRSVARYLIAIIHP